MDQVFLSVVSPVYGCAACLPQLVSGIRAAMEEISCTAYEIVLVNDRSPDDSWEQIKMLANTENVVGLNLSRNFGQHAAIQAGLAHARGEWVVVMDCDLQDQPDQIPALYRAVLKNHDLVLARRAARQDTWLKTSLSKGYYRLLSYLTETQIDPSIANFGIYHRKVVAAILEMGDYVRFFPSMASWVGFRKTTIDVEHAPRQSGASSYNLTRLIRLGLNVIIAFSDKPLRLTVKFGFIVTGLVIVFGLITLFRFLTGEVIVMGYTSLILSIWFLGGIIISILGIVGLYLGKVFDQTRHRPVYIISETTED